MTGRTALLSIALLGLIGWHARAAAADPAHASQRQIDVVFVLDTTGSMGGLIEGAKQKIWSIANGIIATKPTPQVRIGLIAYRDRGDEYVSRRFDLTDDIDAVFANLQSLRADGGGDSPESVNQALDDAVNRIAWSADRGTIKIIFLVGDCPPHMDYADDTKYPALCQQAVRKDLIINTVQCGSDASTTPIWQEIAHLSEGSYVALGQTGDMVVTSTPMDEPIARISAELGRTVVAYGSRAQQAEVAGKSVVAARAPAAIAADRAAYNLGSGGKAVQGRGDLVNDVADGHTELSKLKSEDLPADMRAMTPPQQQAHLQQLRQKRDQLNKELTNLTARRAQYIAAERAKSATTRPADAFDDKVTQIVAEQAARKR